MKLYFIILLLITNLVAKPEFNEPKTLEDYEIPYQFKYINQEKYDILTLNKYIHILYLENRNDFLYKEKSEYLKNSIIKNKYNFDIYFDGYLKTGRKVSDDVINNVIYSEQGIAFHIDKLLFDRDYFLSTNYNILYKRLANINKINKADKVLMIGVLTYMNLYFSSQNLKVLKKMLTTQIIVFEKVKKGVKIGELSKLDFITAKMDLLNLKNSKILAIEDYLKNDYALRQSINSHSQKPFLLQPFNVNLNIESIYKLQKQLINHSSDIAIFSNVLKLRKVELLSKERRFIPEISYYSYVGYTGSVNKKFTLKSDLNTKNWEIGLTIKIPIYNKNEITLQTEKAKYDILLQKNALIKKQKDILSKATNLYQSIKSLNEQIKIGNEKLNLLKEKLSIYKKQLLLGMIAYDKYSVILNEYLKNLKILQNLKQQKMINISLINIMLGKKIVE